MKRIIAVLSCCILFASCSQNMDNVSKQAHLSAVVSSAHSSSPTASSHQAESETITGRSSSALKIAFCLNLPADNAVKLSFFRIGGNAPEIVDITEDTKTITAIIQKINELEFMKSRFSDKEIQMTNGTSSTLRIDYRDGSCKKFHVRGGWYQYSDYGEQWLEKKDGLDLEQFIADEMGVQLWR